MRFALLLFTLALFAQEAVPDPQAKTYLGEDTLVCAVEGCVKPWEHVQARMKAVPAAYVLFVPRAEAQWAIYLLVVADPGEPGRFYIEKDGCRVEWIGQGAAPAEPAQVREACNTLH